MFNELYNTPLAVTSSTPWFHGTEQCTSMTRTCIITAQGVLYTAIGIGENRVIVQKSTDNGFTWEHLKTFEDLKQTVGREASTEGGVPFWIDFSENDRALYIIYAVLDTTVWRPNLYDVTNDTDIGIIGGTTFDLKDFKFSIAGRIDKKIMIMWCDGNDSNIVKATIVDIHHFTAGVRDMVPATPTISGTAVDVVTLRQGLWSISEWLHGWIMWWVDTAGVVKYRRLSIALRQPVPTAGGITTAYAPAAGNNRRVIEIYGKTQSCLITQMDDTQADRKLLYFNITFAGVRTVDMIGDDFELAHATHGDFAFYCAPQMVHVQFNDEEEHQIFWMGFDATGSRNRLYTASIKAKTDSQTIAREVTDELNPDEFNTSMYSVFEGHRRERYTSGSIDAMLVAVGAGDVDGYGHKSGNSSIYLTWLGNKAYPFTVTSTRESALEQPSSEFLASEYKKHWDKHFVKSGMRLLVLKYEPDPEPDFRNRLSFGAPTELEINGFINELSTRNPTNIRLEDSEDFKKVAEKDIRKIYFPSADFMKRTFIRSKKGFILRTVFLLMLYGRFYDITQISAIFTKDGIICYRANLYLAGAGYDPFSRTILPNEL